MNKRIVLFLGVLVGLLIVAAILVTVTQYREPRGAAAGGGAGCGGDPVDSEITEEDATVKFATNPEAPSQIVYSNAEEEENCLKLTIEPLDRVASVEDTCADGKTRVFDLDEDTAESMVASYFSMKEAECKEDECPPGKRVEILTQKEETRLLRYESPLKEHVEMILTWYEAEPEPPTQAQVESKPTPPAPAIGEITLKPEQGAVFVEKQAELNASPLSVDLICYDSSKTVDLQAGAGPTMAKQKHLKLFRTPGGTVKKFGSIDEIPVELPEAEDRDMVHHAEAGMGFIVENNVSPGYTKVFVKDGQDASVILQFQILP